MDIPSIDHKYSPRLDCHYRRSARGPQPVHARMTDTSLVVSVYRLRLKPRRGTQRCRLVSRLTDVWITSCSLFLQAREQCMRREGQLLRIHMKRFRGGLVFKAHRLLYQSTLGVRVIKKTRRCLDHLFLPLSPGSRATNKERRADPQFKNYYFAAI